MAPCTCSLATMASSRSCNDLFLFLQYKALPLCKPTRLSVELRDKIRFKENTKLVEGPALRLFSITKY
uniref:Uncharacterized protein n=1 Tax=Gossypium raimondii TaxID=29730 RepID=A0A0D2TZ97_GOSRA|nr:hypothetical protein B456_013G112600 [Gossypium raimondii]